MLERPSGLPREASASITPFVVNRNRNRSAFAVDVRGETKGDEGDSLN